MQLLEELIEWPYIHWVSIIVYLHFVLSFVSALHIILFKENENTSLAWIGLVILSPVVGSLCYWLFGINRIRRLAKREHPPALKQDFLAPREPLRVENLPQNWHAAIRAGYAIHPVNYEANNQVTPLLNGDMAYPVMIQSIEQAQHHIILASYIFDYDSLGRQFVEALVKAHQRGVKVQVLLDGIGIGYGWHKSDRALKAKGVETARFLPALSVTGTRFINLRNHRKILCVDGKEAFIGGMNISKNNVQASAKHPITDVHFKVVGPVIDQISQVFIEDWYFATRQLIQFPQYDEKVTLSNPHAKVAARIVQDGPDEYHNRIRWTLINALSAAQNSVKIITPYFIPDRTTMVMLHATALRGVTVEIIVPQNNNIAIVGWVMQANFARIIEHGIKIYQSTGSFDHSKLVIIDDIWSFIGSTNWDARSLEFNFEINMECFDKTLNSELTRLFNDKKVSSNLISLEDLKHGSVFKIIRNNFCRLFSPYL